jgi:ATP-dependent Clp protease ATP-binding subunit ClpC
MHFKWTTSLDRQQIENRRAKARIKKFWQYVWYGLSIAGALALAYLIWLNISDLNNLWKQLFTRSYINMIFWLGILGSMFLAYDFLSEFKPTKPLDELIKNEKDTLEINKFFSPESLQAVDNTELARQKDNKNEKWLPFYLLREILESSTGKTLALRLGTNPTVMQKKLDQLITDESVTQSQSDNFLKNIIYKSFEHAVKTKKLRVNIDDLLWALSVLPSNAKDFLVDYDIKQETLQGLSQWLHISRQIIRKANSTRGWKLERAKPWRNQLWTSTVTPLLDSVGRDLTAQTSSFYPLVDREKEMQKIYETIESGSPGILLLGSKGVGMTKLIEGLAQKILAREVPPSLADRRVHTLSLGRILSLSGPQAPIKSLTQQLTKEIQRSENIILILEDLPSLEAVKTEEAAIILEQLLIDSLNSKKLILLATADPKDFVHASGSLMNTLQVIEVKPLDDELTLKVLETMAPYLEYEYKVHLTYQALKRVVDLSKYLHDLAQPAQSVQVLRQICEEQARKKNYRVRRSLGEGGWITGEQVEQIIAYKTNLPLASVSQQETDVLVNLEELIHQKYVDQEPAVKAVASSLRRARTSLKDEHRPIGSFLFLGPTGVGKTELARRLAEIYFKSRDRMIRLDMSEYQETQSLRNLIGAPPGTGSTQEGSLIKAIKENPFSVILLDELEKAHPDILNIFLQVMEDGRLTSSMGETYDFSHSILIGTSNAGAVFIQKALESGLSMSDIDEALKKRELLHSFKPEFINRFDAVVVFQPLSFDQVLIIARILLKDLQDHLAEQGILFEATPAAIQDLARDGFNPAQGARPLRRVIQDKIEDQIAKLILNKKIKQRDKIILQKDFVIDIQQAKHY